MSRILVVALTAGCLMGCNVDTGSDKETLLESGIFQGNAYDNAGLDPIPYTLLLTPDGRAIGHGHETIFQLDHYTVLEAEKRGQEPITLYGPGRHSSCDIHNHCQHWDSEINARLVLGTLAPPVFQGNEQLTGSVRAFDLDLARTSLSDSEWTLTSLQGDWSGDYLDDFELSPSGVFSGLYFGCQLEGRMQFIDDLNLLELAFEIHQCDRENERFSGLGYVTEDNDQLTLQLLVVSPERGLNLTLYR